MQTALGIVLALAPFAALVAVLLSIDRREQSRNDVIARQILLTDAIHGKLGALVAPTVHRKRWGRWEIVIPIPFSDLDVAPALIAMAREAIPEAAQRSPRGLSVVFTPQEEPTTRMHQAPRRPESIESSKRARAAA